MKVVTCDQQVIYNVNEKPSFGSKMGLVRIAILVAKQSRYFLCITCILVVYLGGKASYSNELGIRQGLLN